MISKFKLFWWKFWNFKYCKHCHKMRIHGGSLVEYCFTCGHSKEMDDIIDNHFKT